ncbi:MAG: hypothetical protein RBR97_19680, partial [Bacteroidales bacterium]|nr:hypothetical protein [Bacteroidales bacterium]
MKKIYVILTLILSSFVLCAQDFQILQQYTYGGFLDEYTCDIIKCSQGGYLLGITSLSDSSGNKTTANFGYNNDIWVVKVDEMFNIEWQKSYGTAQPACVGSVLEDDQNNFYVYGQVNEGEGGNISASFVGIAYFVVKLDYDGNEIWQKAYFGENMDNCRKALIYNDRIFLFGGSNSEISFDKTDFCRGSSDYWVVCIDTAGNKIWDKTYGGTDIDLIDDAAYDYENNVIYISGKSRSNAGYEKSQDAYNSQYLRFDSWVLKIDAETGELIWDKTIGNDAEGQRMSIALSDSYLYCATSNSGDASGDKTENSLGESDFWILKLDFEGNIIWDRTIGGVGRDAAGDLIVRNDNQILIAGISNSPISFDKTEDPRFVWDVGDEILYKTDFWFVCINDNGEVLWDKTIGGMGFESGARIIINPDNDNLICTGTSTSEVSGDKTSPYFGETGTYYGVPDIWVFEMTLPAISGIDLVTKANLSVYPNPASE